MALHSSRYPGRLLAVEATGISDHKILELALCALPEHDSEKLSKALLSKFGSYPRVLSAPSGELLLIEGLGTVGVALLKTIHAAALSLLRAEATNGPVLNNWRRLMGYLHAELSRGRVQQLQILYLDNRYRLLKDETHQRGTVDHTPAYPREVAKRALELNASALILAHNHPSGDPTPSSDDISMTEQIRVALATLSIELYDHIVIGHNRFISLREQGLLRWLAAEDLRQLNSHTVGSQRAGYKGRCREKAGGPGGDYAPR